MRTLSEILIEAEKATTLNDVKILCGEFFDNKKKYPLVEVLFFQEYVEEIIKLKNLSIKVSFSDMQPRLLADVERLGSPMGIDESEFEQDMQYNAEVIASAFGIPSDLLHKQVKGVTFKPKTNKNGIIKFVLKVIDKIFGSVNYRIIKHK